MKTDEKHRRCDLAKAFMVVRMETLKNAISIKNGDDPTNWYPEDTEFWMSCAYSAVAAADALIEVLKEQE